jgi:hypothetical protein
MTFKEAQQTKQKIIDSGYRKSIEESEILIVPKTRQDFERYKEKFLTYELTDKDALYFETMGQFSVFEMYIVDNIIIGQDISHIATNQ